MLVAARALQGVFGALLAPAALSLLTTTFTDPAERGKAFGIYGAIAGMGGAIGLLLGGVLTEALDWRWCLYVSIAFALPAAIAGTAPAHHVPAPARPRLDIPGALPRRRACSRSSSASRARSPTAGAIRHPRVPARRRRPARRVRRAAAPRRHPLLPLRVVADRDRGASFLAIGTASAGLFGLFLFLTFYLQDTKG